MISELDVTFVFRESTYGTFAEAVNAVETSPRTARAEKDNATTTNVSVVAYSLEASEASCALSDSRTLRVYCSGDNIEWEIAARRAPLRPPRIYSDNVVLRFPDASTIDWRPYAMLQARLNRQSLTLDPSETLVYLRARGVPGLMFAQMTDRAGGGVTDA